MRKIKRIKFFIFFILLGCIFSSRQLEEMIEAQDDISSGHFDLAVTKYKQILNGNPPEDIKIKIYFQLGELYSLQLNKHKEAVSYFTEIQKITSSPVWLVNAQEKIADIYFSFLKNYKIAAEKYSKLVKFSPPLTKNDFYQFRWAVAKMQAREFNSSIRILKEIAIDPSHKYQVESLYYLGMSHFLKKEWQMAINYWKEYIKKEKRKDKIVKTKFILANTYETMERLKEAYRIYYSILGDYPNSEVILGRLKSLYLRRISRKR